jgi:hypothetical protein
VAKQQKQRNCLALSTSPAMHLNTRRLAAKQTSRLPKNTGDPKIRHSGRSEAESRNP